MALKFFNIRTGETQVAESEPKIAALWASSDRSPNITQGQDFGWRLAPEVIVELKRIKNDRQKLLEIAQMYQRPLEDVGEKEILAYISDMTPLDDAPVAEHGDYEDQYDAEVRRALAQAAKADEAANAPVHPTPSEMLITSTTTESLESLQKRVELEERLAAARAKNETTTTTTTKAPTTTTTTTTKAPTTTTTTTKKQ